MGIEGHRSHLYEAIKCFSFLTSLKNTCKITPFLFKQWLLNTVAEEGHNYTFEQNTIVARDLCFFPIVVAPWGPLSLSRVSPYRLVEDINTSLAKSYMHHIASCYQWEPFGWCCCAVDRAVRNGFSRAWCLQSGSCSKGGSAPRGIPSFQNLSACFFAFF